MRKIYVASSWRNIRQPEVVKALRAEGFDVYDFKNPREGDNGFHWSEIDQDWKNWTPAQFRDALKDPIAKRGFESDKKALDACDACVLVLPCGRSSHLELGHAAGELKATYVLIEEPSEPELMYSMVNRICLSLDELVEAIVSDFLPF